VSAVVANTGGRGINLRWTPGGLVAGTLPEGTIVRILNERAETDLTVWVKIIDQTNRLGWVAEQYLLVQP
jgi:hypothetical protein